MPDHLNKRIADIEKRLHKIELELSAPRQQNPTSVGPTHTAAEKGDATPGHRLSVPPSPAHPKNTNKGRSATPPRRKFRTRAWRWVKRIFLKRDRLERIGIFFGICYALATIMQWHDLRHNFEVDQRAWFKVSYIFPDTITPHSTPTIRIDNVGKSAASQAVADGNFEVLGAKKAPDFDKVQMRTIQHLPLMFPGDHSAFPVVLSGQVHEITPQQLNDLAMARAYIVLYGVTKYSDQFGKHWTRHCVWQTYVRPEYAMSGNFNANSCVSYNSVGDGEPP